MPAPVRIETATVYRASDDTVHDTLEGALRASAWETIAQACQCTPGWRCRFNAYSVGPSWRGLGLEVIPNNYGPRVAARLVRFWLHLERKRAA